MSSAPPEPTEPGPAVSGPAVSGPAERIASQLAFVIEIDRLKGVLRQTSLCDGSRRENSAEHSWHLATMATVLGEHAGADVDVSHVIRMLLVHDLVEIDAGDTFAYDASANVGREAREREAAERLFGLLPGDQAAELRALWEEFEAQATPAARFAAALDRLQPLLNNHRGNGGSWREHAVTRTQVLTRMRPIESALPAFWPSVMAIVDENCACGHIRDDRKQL
jgi:putative hydrolase of HD superfamily